MVVSWGHHLLDSVCMCIDLTVSHVICRTQKLLIPFTKLTHRIGMTISHHFFFFFWHIVHAAKWLDGLILCFISPVFLILWLRNIMFSFVSVKLLCYFLLILHLSQCSWRISLWGLYIDLMPAEELISQSGLNSEEWRRYAAATDGDENGQPPYSILGVFKCIPSFS